MDIRIAGIVNDSIVDGPGIRFTIFTQGCPHKCEGCHNPQTHTFGGGKLVSIEELIDQIQHNPLLDGVTFSGGEPFVQAEALSALAKVIHDNTELNVVTYTGYTFEQLMSGLEDNPHWKTLLQETDILIDGPFIQSKKSYELHFRGSSNQRCLDSKESVRLGKAVEIAI